MDPFFTELGRNVLSRWQAKNFSLEAFPDIATTALSKSAPAKNVVLPLLMRDFLLEEDQPFQSQSGFGQPELIVYDNPRFYIQILFWFEGTTDIHQHMFSGAFHVLHGSSIHSQFAFEDAESISAHLRVGNLRMKSTRLLETGSTEPIVSGRGFVHSLFHLDTPSLTVVVRTHTDPGTGPQFTYLPPHLAVDPDHFDTLTQRRKQLLDALEQTGDPAYPGLVVKMIQQLDFERGFFILQNCLGYLHRIDYWEEAFQAFAKKHGKLADYVAPTIDEIVRRDGLVAMRGEVTEIEHRFFLALLLNVPNRTDILRMVGQRFKGAPEKTVLRWAQELMQISDYGATLLDAHLPEEIGVAPEEQAGAILAGLQHLLAGTKSAGKKAAKGLSPKEEKLMRAVFQNSSLRALVTG